MKAPPSVSKGVTLARAAGLSTAPAQEYVWGRNRKERRRNKKLAKHFYPLRKARRA